MSQAEPHSTYWLGDWRLHMWDPDYLALLGRRWGTADVSHMVDVGAGAGHWSLPLLGILPEHATITAVDMEAHWVETLGNTVKTLGLSDRIHPIQGRAEALPVANGGADMVTCQTVLMHVANPAAVLLEMKRVLRPGGVLVCVEPCNRANQLTLDSTWMDRPVEENVGRVRMHLTCEVGRRALNEGDISIGDRLPGLVTAAGFEQLHVCTAEKAIWLEPPYSQPGQRDILAVKRTNAEQERIGWDKAETQRYFLAGGGQEADFDALWHTSVVLPSRRFLEQADSGRYRSPGGFLGYIVSARKPA